MGWWCSGEKGFGEGWGLWEGGGWLLVVRVEDEVERRVKSKKREIFSKEGAGTLSNINPASYPFPNPTTPFLPQIPAPILIPIATSPTLLLLYYFLSVLI